MASIRKQYRAKEPCKPEFGRNMARRRQGRMLRFLMLVATGFYVGITFKSLLITRGKDQDYETVLSLPSVWNTDGEHGRQRVISKPRPLYTGHSPYAYAFVIGGCTTGKSNHRGFLFNILVATRILRELGSTADVVAFFQLSLRTLATELPADEIRLLRALGIKIEYIPKAGMESFYDTVMHKFDILKLTQYRRVLLLDGDVMPLANLDYFFELSDGPDGKLKENLVITGPKEPANGGFFMLEPAEGLWEEVQQVIATRELTSNNVSDDEGHKFDKEYGWGHKIEAPDMWVARTERGTLWDFHFAFSDQGLLYHYVKYMRKSVSILSSDGWVENWGRDHSGLVQKEEVFQVALDTYRTPLILDKNVCKKFLCEIKHFSGYAKPWLSETGPPEDLSEATKMDDALHFWWWKLRELNEELSMGLDFASWQPHLLPPLGLWARIESMDRRVDVRTRKAFQP